MLCLRRGLATVGTLAITLTTWACIDVSGGLLAGPPSPPPTPANDGAFSLRATPAAFTVAPGGAQSVEILVTRTGSFIGALTLATTNPSAGIAAALSQTRVDPVSTRVTLTVSAGATSPPGTYILTVTGTGTSVGSQSVDIVVTITAS